jgi:hypothetical protein
MTLSFKQQGSGPTLILIHRAGELFSGFDWKAEECFVLSGPGDAPIE